MRSVCKKVLWHCGLFVYCGSQVAYLRGAGSGCLDNLQPPNGHDCPAAISSRPSCLQLVLSGGAIYRVDECRMAGITGSSQY